MKKDVFSRGFFAGAIAGIAMLAWSLLSGAILQIPHLRNVDWMAIMIFGHAPAFEVIETGIAMLGNIFFCGILGIGFAYILPLIKNENIYFKGWVFSLSVWFTAYVISTMYKIEGTLPTSIETTILNAVGATVYGFTLAYATKRLLYGETESSYGMNLAPAMKPLGNREGKEK